jgi:ATP-dependent Lhr-like helicase
MRHHLRADPAPLARRGRSSGNDDLHRPRHDVLRRHQADHILLRAARQEAAHGLLDIRRLATMLTRIRGHIVHAALDHVSPLAVPVMLEIGRESVYGEASESLLAEAELVNEAMR